MYQSVTEFIEEIAGNTESYIEEMLGDTCDNCSFTTSQITNQETQIDWGDLDVAL